MAYKLDTNVAAKTARPKPAGDQVLEKADELVAGAGDQDTDVRLSPLSGTGAVEAVRSCILPL